MWQLCAHGIIKKDHVIDLRTWEKQRRYFSECFWPHQLNEKIGKLAHQRNFGEIVLFFKGDYNQYLKLCDDHGNFVASVVYQNQLEAPGVQPSGQQPPSESPDVASSLAARSEAVDTVVQSASQPGSPPHPTPSPSAPCSSKSPGVPAAATGQPAAGSPSSSTSQPASPLPPPRSPPSCSRSSPPRPPPQSTSATSKSPAAGPCGPMSTSAIEEISVNSPTAAEPLSLKGAISPAPVFADPARLSTGTGVSLAAPPLYAADADRQQTASSLGGGFQHKATLGSSPASVTGSGACTDEQKEALAFSPQNVTSPTACTEERARSGTGPQPQMGRENYLIKTGFLQPQMGSRGQ